MLMIWNENCIIKEKKIFINNSEKIQIKNEEIKPKKNELIWILKTITEKEIIDLDIKIGYFDYPFEKEFKQIKIGLLKIKKKTKKSIIIYNNERESPLIIYEVLNLYKNMEENTGYWAKLNKNIFDLISEKEIIVECENINIIPELEINSIKITIVE